MKKIQNWKYGKLFLACLRPWVVLVGYAILAAAVLVTILTQHPRRYLPSRFLSQTTR